MKINASIPWPWWATVMRDSCHVAGNTGLDLPGDSHFSKNNMRLVRHSELVCIKQSSCKPTDISSWGLAATPQGLLGFQGRKKQLFRTQHSCMAAAVTITSPSQPRGCCAAHPSTSNADTKKQLCLPHQSILTFVLTCFPRTKWSHSLKATKDKTTCTLCA